MQASFEDGYHSTSEVFRGDFATTAEKASVWTQAHLRVQHHKALTGSLATILIITICFVLSILACKKAADANANNPQNLPANTGSSGNEADPGLPALAGKEGALEKKTVAPAYRSWSCIS